MTIAGKLQRGEPHRDGLDAIALLREGAEAAHFLVHELRHAGDAIRDIQMVLQDDFQASMQYPRKRDTTRRHCTRTRLPRGVILFSPPCATEIISLKVLNAPDWQQSACALWGEDEVLVRHPCEASLHENDADHVLQRSMHEGYQDALSPFVPVHPRHCHRCHSSVP